MDTHQRLSGLRVSNRTSVHRSSFASLRARLLLVVFLAILPALVPMLYTAWEQRRMASDEVRGNALRFVRIAASNQERSIAAAREVLVALAQVHEVHGGDRAACTRVCRPDD